jgi:hypothetical protein
MSDLKVRPPLANQACRPELQRHLLGAVFVRGLGTGRGDNGLSARKLW